MQAVPVRHASPAPHSASDVHTAVEVPHLPHELQTDVPLTSAWHALKPVAEPGLHPLNVSAAPGAAKLYDCRSTPQTGLGLLGVDEEVGTTEEVDRVLVGRSLDVGEKVMVDWLEERVLDGRTVEVERMSDTVDERLGTVEERLGTLEDELTTTEDA